LWLTPHAYRFRPPAAGPPCCTQSLPARRSSDLWSAAFIVRMAIIRRISAVRIRFASRRGHAVISLDQKRRTLATLRRSRNIAHRSEEYTSERQTRENLVCRRVVEKKTRLNVCHV